MLGREQDRSSRPDREPTRPKVTPRSKLEELLTGEKAGSIKVMAISDFTRRTALEYSSALARLRGEPITMYIESLAILDEKIRERQFGEQADAYIEAYERFETEVFPLYYHQERAKRRMQRVHREYDEEAFHSLVQSSAASNASNDLYEINREKSKQDNKK